MANKYKARTLIDALQKAQEDLGPDAIVLSSRTVPIGPIWNPWKDIGIEIIASPAITRPATRPVLRAAPSSVDGMQQGRPDEYNARAYGNYSSPEGEAKSANRASNQPENVAQAAVAQPPRWQPDHITKKDIKPPVRNSGIQENRVSTPAAIVPPKPAVKISLETPKTEKPVEIEKTVLDIGKLPPNLQKLRTYLLKQELEESLVDRMLKVGLETMDKGSIEDMEVCKKYISQLLEAELRIQDDPEVDLSNRIIFLVGASGSGKTSTVAKLVIYFIQKYKKKVAWISADTIRTGAIVETKAYTDAIGIPLKLAYSPEELKNAIDSEDKADLILVDVPGFNPYDENQVVELGSYLTEVNNRTTYLVASASTKESDLYQVVAAMGIFTLQGLIVTKLDETYRYGSVYNVARKSQLPLTYFTTGKEAFGNLEIASSKHLVAALFGKGWK